MEYRVMSELHFETHWNILCRVKCLHSYYPDGICGDLEFDTTPATQQIMRNLRILCKPEQDGIVLLYEKDKERDLLRKAQSAAYKLSFKIRARDSEVFSFSQLPWHPDLRLFHLHNTTDNQTRKGDLYLHQGDFIHHDLENRPLMKPLAFDYKVSQPLPRRSIKITMLSGETIEPPEDADDHPRTQYLIDLRRYGSGKYVVKATGEPDMNVYCVERWDEFAIGYMDIFLNGRKKYGNLISKNSITPQNYFISLEARSTFWKYILVGRPQRNGSFDPTDIEVRDQGKVIKFSKPEKIALQNGATAYSIESKDQIPFLLVRSNLDRLDLKLKLGNKWLNKPIALPKPNVQMIKPDRAKDKLYAVTYINI